MEGRCCCSSSPLAHSNVACAYVWEGYELTAGCHLERAAAVRAGARQHGVALRRVDDAVAVAGRSAHGSTDVEAPFHQGRGPGIVDCGRCIPFLLLTYLVYFALPSLG